LTTLEGLQHEEVNAGKYLKLRLIEPCFRKNALMALGEDHTQRNCIEIGLLNYDLKGKHYDEVLSTNSILYLKEPFLTIASIGGRSVLRVDDQRDVVLEN
jgi:hypothetical protein